MKTFLNFALFGLSVVSLITAVSVHQRVTTTFSDVSTLCDVKRGDIFGDSNFVRAYDENGNLIYSVG